MSGDLKKEIGKKISLEYVRQGMVLKGPDVKKATAKFKNQVNALGEALDREFKAFDSTHNINIYKKSIQWSTIDDKLSIIRQGLPYVAIEALSNRTDIPIKRYLDYLDIVQTTYNKKKKSKSLLSKQDTEAIMELTELYDYGLYVFNNEKDKFHRWLKKPNISLGGATPESLFDSITGINEIRKALNRLEYGNMA